MRETKLPRKTAPGTEAPRAEQSKHLDSAAAQDFTPEAAAHALQGAITGLQGALTMLAGGNPGLAAMYALAGIKAADAAIDALRAVAGG